MNFIMIVCIVIPLLVIAIEIKKKLDKHFALKKVFDINREVKNLKNGNRYTKMSNSKIQK